VLEAAMPALLLKVSVDFYFFLKSVLAVPPPWDGTPIPKWLFSINEFEFTELFK